MATSTTTSPPAAPAALPADRARARALRRRLLPLAAAWALLVTLPVGWIVLGELTDSVTAHGTRSFPAPWADVLSAVFLLACLAPCVASCGLSLLAWHRGADVGRARALLLLPGGLAGGVIGWCADQVQRGPVLAATAVLVAAMLGGAAWRVAARARPAGGLPGDTRPT